MDDPVQAQVDAYNAGDVDAFVACYTRDAVVRDGDGNELVNGEAALRAAYAPMFAANPDLHAEIVDRRRVGVWTVDHERVTRSGTQLEVLVAYRVEDGLIDRVVMLR